MNNRLIDQTLQIHPVAYKILSLLALCSDEDFVGIRGNQDLECKTSSWYNGRERGICLEVRTNFASHETCLIVTFGEERGSDDIFVDAWEHKGFFLNPPTLAAFTEAAYHARKTFAADRQDLALQYILRVIHSFIQRQAALQSI